MSEMSDHELLDALGVDTQAKKKVSHTPREERIIAGFEEIQRFVDKHDRHPQHGEDKEIFERLYAVRLDQIRRQEKCRALLEEIDYQDLLVVDNLESKIEASELDDEALLEQLGVPEPDEDDVTQLKHVKPRSETRNVNEVASRIQCKDFNLFEPIFSALKKDLEAGARETRPFKDGADIIKGDLFILSGQIVYVAEVGEYFKAPNGDNDARLRAIYDNGTESDILLRSLQRALYKDPAGRRIIDLSPGPLFDGVKESDDLESGTIYVLRSKSEHPIISKNRDIVHKIGVTGGDVKTRVANAKLDPTFLMAEVEVVATYTLYNINRTKLEKLLHKFFESSRLDIQINDRFGNPVVPREWFFVPRFVIDEVVEKIQDGSISKYYYDNKLAKLIESK